MIRSRSKLEQKIRELKAIADVQRRIVSDLPWENYQYESAAARLRATLLELEILETRLERDFNQEAL